MINLTLESEIFEKSMYGLETILLFFFEKSNLEIDKNCEEDLPFIDTIDSILFHRKQITQNSSFLICF